MAERFRFAKGRPFSSGDILRIAFNNLTLAQQKEVFCVILAITRNLPRQQGAIEKALVNLLKDYFKPAKIVDVIFEILEFTRKKGEFQLTEAD